MGLRRSSLAFFLFLWFTVLFALTRYTSAQDYLDSSEVPASRDETNEAFSNSASILEEEQNVDGKRVVAKEESLEVACLEGENVEYSFNGRKGGVLEKGDSGLLDLSSNRLQFKRKLSQFESQVYRDSMVSSVVLAGEKLLDLDGKPFAIVATYATVTARMPGDCVVKLLIKPSIAGHTLEGVAEGVKDLRALGDAALVAKILVDPLRPRGRLDARP